MIHVICMNHSYRLLILIRAIACSLFQRAAALHALRSYMLRADSYSYSLPLFAFSPPSFSLFVLSVWGWRWS